MKIRLFFFNFLICGLHLQTLAQTQGATVSQNTTQNLPVTQITVTQPSSANTSGTSSTVLLPSSSATGATSETISISPTNNPAGGPIDNTGVPTTIGQRSYEYPSYCTEDLYPAEDARSEKLKQKRLSFLLKKVEELKTSDKKDDFKKVVFLYFDEIFLQKKSTAYLETEFKKLRHFIDEETQVYGSALIEKRRRHFSEAQKILLKYLEAHPKNIKNMELIARVYQAQKNYVEAANAFEDLQKLNPQKDYLLDLCENSSWHHDHESTKKFCTQLQKKHPKSEKSTIYLGISERDRENYKKAISFFKESVKTKPTEFGYTCLGESLVLDKKFNEAIEAFSESVKIAPHSKRAQLGLALNYVETKDYQKALGHFKASCELGEKPLKNFAAILEILKNTKNPLHEDYFKLVQMCQHIKIPAASD